MPACYRAVSAPEDLVEKTLIHFIIIKEKRKGKRGENWYPNCSRIVGGMPHLFPLLTVWLSVDVVSAVIKGANIHNGRDLQEFLLSPP